jgi:hypothetical protein
MSDEADDDIRPTLGLGEALAITTGGAGDIELWERIGQEWVKPPGRVPTDSVTINTSAGPLALAVVEREVGGRHRGAIRRRLISIGELNDADE